MRIVPFPYFEVQYINNGSYTVANDARESHRIKSAHKSNLRIYHTKVLPAVRGVFWIMSWHWKRPGM